jgi:hypothetical protein
MHARKTAFKRTTGCLVGKRRINTEEQLDQVRDAVYDVYEVTGLRSIDGRSARPGLYAIRLLSPQRLKRMSQGMRIDYANAQRRGRAIGWREIGAVLGVHEDVARGYKGKATLRQYLSITTQGNRKRYELSLAKLSADQHYNLVKLVRDLPRHPSAEKQRVARAKLKDQAGRFQRLAGSN